jgi:L-threonylcarbamoyladenylate synthase
MGVDEVVEAIGAGRPVILPTDTVYGLCVRAFHREDARRLYRLKGRADAKPTAILCSDVGMLLECVPELRGRSARIASVLLPGPYTLIFPNPGRTYPWLTGSRPETIGVRVPHLEGEAHDVLERIGALAATSANAAGGPDPRTLEEVPAPIRHGAGAVLDAGELPGVPSTVIDFTGPEPVVLREGAASSSRALERLSAVLS